MKKLLSLLSTRFFIIIFIIFLMLIIADGNKRDSNVVYNANGVKSLEAMHIITKYDAAQTKTISVSTMSEVATYGPTNPVSFVGQLTGYGSDCEGCGGTVSCPPRPNILESIVFQDGEYGEVRILAADRTIPCGSIIRIQNVSFATDPIYGIVLDRGGAIQGNIIDYLVESEKFSASNVGRQKNVQFEIIRWGW